MSIAKFIPIVQMIATLSKDPRTKVGAAILDSNRRIRAVGYNGFPRGVHDDAERYNDRALKHTLVAHAEANAVANAAAVGTPLEGCSMIVTKFPCHECAKLIINAGIKLVYAPHPEPTSDWLNSNTTAAYMFDEAGVKVETY